MHPDRRFHPHDRDAMLRFVGETGFAHLFAATPEGPMVVHVPLTWDAGALCFHVSRANRIAPHLADARVLASVAGPQGYVSPGWYAKADAVPTWNFVTVEVEGVARPLGAAALVAHLDAIAAAHEPRAGAPRPWTRPQTDPAYFDRLLGGIHGFELSIGAVRGTTKLSQNKPAEERARVAAGLAAAGNAALAALMA